MQAFLRKLNYFSRHTKLYAIAILIFLQTTEIISAKELQRLYRSGYFLGRGDTGIAHNDNEDSIFYNPAGLAQGKGIYKKTILLSPLIEVSEDTKNLVRQIVVEKNTSVDTLRSHMGIPQHVGLYNYTGIIFRRVAFGLLTSTQQNILIYKSPDEAALEVIDIDSYATQAAYFSLAEQFWNEKLLLGVNMKYLMRGEGHLSASVADNESLTNIKQEDVLGYGTGSGADFGLMFKTGNKRIQNSFGIMVENIGDIAITPEQETSVLEPPYQKINVGVAMTAGTRVSRFRFLADIKDCANREEKNFLKKVHLGTELSFADYIGFTGGLNQGYMTGGIYADFRFIRLDAGAYTEEMGERAGSRRDERFFVKLTAGF